MIFLFLYDSWCWYLLCIFFICNIIYICWYLVCIFLIFYIFIFVDICVIIIILYFYLTVQHSVHSCCEERSINKALFTYLYYDYYQVFIKLKSNKQKYSIIQNHKCNLWSCISYHAKRHGWEACFPNTTMTKVNTQHWCTTTLSDIALL